MTKPTWAETVIAGKLFAALTSEELAVLSEWSGFESITLDHGALRIKTNDGREFEVTVRRR